MLFRSDPINYNSDLIDIFYNDCVINLVEFISNGSLQLHNESYTTSLHLTLDLLVYCTKINGAMMREHVIHKEILQRLDGLYRYPMKYIRLGMIKYLKSLLDIGDDMLKHYIASYDLLRSVIDLANKLKKDNLLKSAIIDLFITISKSNNRVLITYLGSTYNEFFVTSSLSTHPIMKEILSKYEEYEFKDPNEDYENLAEERIM